MSLVCTAAVGARAAGESCTAPAATISGYLVDQVDMLPDALSELSPTTPSCTVNSFHGQSWILTGFQYSEDWDTFVDGQQPLHPAKWEFSIQVDRPVKLELGSDKWERLVPTEVYDCYIKTRSVIYTSPYAADLAAKYTLDMDRKALEIFMSWTCHDLDPSHP